MNTNFKTGPGFFAAFTAGHDKDLAPGKMRIYCASIEVYEIDHTGDEGTDITWEILCAKADKKPRVAFALLQLAKHIESNRKFLEGVYGK